MKRNVSSCRAWAAQIGGIALLLAAGRPEHLCADGYPYTPHGTPYAWLQQHELATDVHDDDWDGRLTWEEYVAGGNPTNAEGEFAISALAVDAATNWHLRWPSSDSGSPDPYRLRFTTNLLMDPDDWPIIGFSPRTPPTNVWDGAGPWSGGFFRVEALHYYSPGVTLSVAGAPLAEPAGAATITASLSAPYYQPVGVVLDLAGTATVDEDYSISALNLLIPAGQASQSATLSVLDDHVPENLETAVVSISAVVNGQEVGEQAVAVAIASEDPKPPRIRVVKVAAPHDPQDFTYTGDLARSFSLDDDDDPTLPNARWFGPLEPGSYKLAESAESGWDLERLAVVDPDGGSTVDLANRSCLLDLDDGETVTAVFNNVKRGRIAVVKDSVPNNPQDFEFAGDLGSFYLDDDADPKLGHAMLFTNLPPGKYRVAERAVSGWNLTALVVDDPDGGSSVDMAAGEALLELDPGEDVVARFVNHSQSNDAPVADAGGPYFALEGSGVVLDASASGGPDAPYGDAIARYEWDLDNDGTFETKPTPENEPRLELDGPALAAFGLDDGPALRPIRLRVTDGLGASDTNDTLIELLNVRPRATDLVITPGVPENASAVLAGHVVDPGNDTFQLQLDWGDGTIQDVDLASPPPGATFDPATRAFTVAHVYLDDGPAPGNGLPLDLMRVAGVVADDDGGMSAISGASAPWVANDDNATGWTVTQQIHAGEPIGQTFQAVSDNRLATVSMYLADMNAEIAPGDHSVEFLLYEGIGTGGLPLGRRICTNLEDGFVGWIAVDFDTVTLQPGATYTIALENDTARWGRVASGNQYAGGTAIYGGTASSTADSLFRVDWQAASEAPQLANGDNATGWTVTQQIQAGEPIGQTFKAIAGTRLDTISAYVADMNAETAPGDHAVTLSLYEGFGASGQRLGSRECTNLVDGFTGWVAADFSAVTLQAGATYTIALENDTARWGRVAGGNQYAGGTAIYAGAASPTVDSLFRVVWQAAGGPPQLANDENATGWTVTQQIQAGAPIGQTFTAISGNRLATIAAYVADMNAATAPIDHTLSFELYEGAGTGGRLLGRRDCADLVDGFAGWVEVDFGEVTLRPGATYAIVLENDTARWGRVACGNQYAGGIALYADASSPSADMFFRVQWQPDGAAPRVANDDNSSGWTVTQQIQAGEPIGQSFTAISGNRLATIAAYVADMNAETAPDDYSVSFTLYEGLGTGGRYLGQRDYTNLVDSSAGWVEVDFGEVTLAAGQAYTLVLENDTARWGRVASGNQYAGGTGWYAGLPSPTMDMLFRVQWQPDGAAPLLANDDNGSGWTVTQQIQAGEPIGQIFTAISDHRLAYAAMYMGDMNAAVAPDDHTVEFQLYEGIGTSGRLLGTRESPVLADGFAGWVAVDFGAVTLQAGAIYTIVLENDTARWGRMACGNQYAGGMALYAGAPSTSMDAFFRVAWRPDFGALSTVVSNVAPAFEAGLDEILRQGVLNRTIPFADPGMLDAHAVTVDYGDGTAVATIPVALGAREFTLEHLYEVSGNFAVSIGVADDDAGAGMDGFTVRWGEW